MIKFKVKFKPKPVVYLPSTGLYEQMKTGNKYTYEPITLDKLKEVMTNLYFGKYDGKA